MQSSTKKRSRAARACDNCRQRRIKCDAEVKIPCTMCEHFVCDCSFQGISKSTPSKGYIESLDTRLEKVEGILRGYHPISMDAERPPKRHCDLLQPGPRLTETEHLAFNYNGGKILRHIGASSAYYDMDTNHQLNDTREDVALTSDDMFDFIPHDLRIGIMKRFVDHQSLMTPIIEKEEMEEYIKQPPTYPLLLCAFCSYVHSVTPLEDSFFEDHGITDRNQFDQRLLSLESVLVRQECMTSSIHNIQSLLILGCRPTHIRNFNLIWLRIGLAIRMCQDLGFHLKLQTVPYSEKMDRLGKKLWYTAYVFDRWLSSVLGRPMAIQDSDCSVPLPVFSQEDHCGESFVLFIKLSWILGEVQRQLYRPQSKSRLRKLTTNQQLDQIKSLEALLGRWFEQIPEHLLVTIEDIKALECLTPQDRDTLLATNRWQLGGHLLVGAFAVHILIHRQFGGTDEPRLFIDSSAARCTELSCLGTDLVTQLPRSCYSRVGWNFLTYSGVLCSLILLDNLTSTDPKVVSTAKHYFESKIIDWLVLLESSAPFNSPVRPQLRQALKLLKLGNLFKKVFTRLASDQSQPSSPCPASPANHPLPLAEPSHDPLPSSDASVLQPSSDTTLPAERPLLDEDLFASLRTNFIDGLPSTFFGMDTNLFNMDLTLEPTQPTILDHAVYASNDTTPVVDLDLQ
ncbi:hypothetical protein DM01DRAFT_357927 [Hesseltinella vesiculosa]|uniref:Zn(2)-C6 fungal-type domain-containing protein n=1 Tax=Hesseltinella vesiculosa TaxID=101127 RepID=A0A1X2GAI6_9FUNG|nr:hypothetical protein DM01DRAFT_357927 [Hesseltinella vesiculosa]